MEKPLGSISRRELLGNVAKAGVALACIKPTDAAAQAPALDAQAAELAAASKRKLDARSIREQSGAHGTYMDASFTAASEPAESLRITQFSKALRRDEHGGDPTLPLTDAFASMKAVLDAAFKRSFSGGQLENAPDFAAFDELAKYIGEPDEPNFLYTNPLGGLSFELEGLDPALSPMPAPPQFSSDQNAAEMAEAYWLALLRDEHFKNLDPKNPGEKFKKALEDLNTYEWFSSPEAKRPPLTAETLFRAQLPAADLKNQDPKTAKSFAGVEVGPYLSQFLVRGTMDPTLADENNGPNRGIVNFGSLRLNQRQRTVRTRPMVERGRDYLMNPDKAAAYPPDKSIDEFYRVENGRRSNIGKDDFDKKDIEGGNVERPAVNFLRTLRDGTNYVHFDLIYQEYMIAAAILLARIPRRGDTKILKISGLASGAPSGATTASVSEKERLRNATESLQYRSEFGIPKTDLLNAGNPYKYADAQVGFATFGLTHILTLLAEVSTRAHKCGWYHKWLWRRIRPEEYGARVHYQVRHSKQYGIPQELTESAQLTTQPKSSVVLKNISEFIRYYYPDQHGKGEQPNPYYLLPQAFPEGCPTHPAYPSGHATVAGACVTLLKGLFNETAALTGFEDMNGKQVVAYQVNTDGTALEPLPEGLKLSVGGELNKLASNITYFRQMAGVHWASDNTEGILLGERLALELLVEQTHPSRRPGENTTFYRERLPEPVATAITNGNRSPFFRLTTFAGISIDIHDAKISLIAEKPNPDEQDTWVRSPDSMEYRKFIELYYRTA